MKKFSFNPFSFFIGAAGGFVGGVVLMGILAYVFFLQAVNRPVAQGGLFSGQLNNLLQDIVMENTLANSKSIHGKVTSNEGGAIALDGTVGGETKPATFLYDDSTQFITYAHDDASTKMLLKASDIMPGDIVTVFANETVGSVPNQHAVEVLKL